MAPAAPPPPHARLFHLVAGSMITQALAIVARARIADQLASGPKSVAELAEVAGVDEGVLFRFLRGLASVGVFEETTPRVFAQNPVSDLLREDAPVSFHDLSILFAGSLYEAWGSADDALRSPKSVFADTFGEEFFDYIGKRPEEQQLFARAMSGMARGRVEVLFDADWTGVTKVVDVGGGNGTLLVALTRRVPHVQGIVFDLPDVAELARKNVEEAGLGARISCAGGSFFDTSPPPADAYVLSRILHDWGDADCLRILRSIRSAAPPGARLYVLDDVIAEGNAPHPAKLLDLQMLIVSGRDGGKERTHEEWRALLDAGGFVMKGVTPGLVARIDAVRA